MPRGVAAASLLGGVAVMAFGGILLFLRPPVDNVSMPRATLEPVPSDAAARETERGVMGRVVMSDGPGVADHTVELVPLFEGRGAKQLKTSTDSKGSFRFDDVKIDPGSPYVAEVSFDGGRFASAVLRGPRARSAPIRLVVAPTTRSPDWLVVRAESLAVVGDGSGSQAVHVLNIENTGRRAFIGALQLPLLPGAAAIQQGPGLDRRRLDLAHGAMVSSTPVLPGRHDVTYTYVTQMPKDGLALAREVKLPTDRYELLVAGDLDLDGSERLRPEGDVTIGPRGEERAYERFVARDLAPGDRVGGRIAPAAGSDALRVVAPVAAIVLAILALAIPLVRRRRTAVPTPQRAATT